MKENGHVHLTTSIRALADFTGWQRTNSAIIINNMFILDG